MAALQTEHSLWERFAEDGLLALTRELGIVFVPWAPLGHSMLTGKIRSTDWFDEGDFRSDNPRFTAENFQRNLRIVDEVEAIAAQAGATAAQISLAWLLAQGDNIVPIPGIEKVAYLEENAAADALELTSEQRTTSSAGRSTRGSPPARSAARR